MGKNVEQLRTGLLHSVSGYILYSYRLIEIVIILFFLYWYSQKKSIFLSPLKISFLLFCLFFVSTLAARRAIAVPLLTGVIIYHYARKKISLKKILLIGMVFFVLLAILGYFRYQGEIKFGDRPVSSRFLKELNLYSSLLFMTTEYFPEKTEFMGWNGFIQPFKSILPGNQKSTGNILKEDVMKLEFRGGGFMPSILGGFYMNFGWGGIIIGMFLCGLVLNVLYLNMLNRNNEYSLILYAYVSVYSVSTIQGMMLGEVWPIYVILILILVHLYCKKRESHLLKRVNVIKSLKQNQRTK